MGITTMDGKVKELRELKRMAEELNAEIEAITDQIKAEMTARKVDTLAGTDWKATWREVKSSREELDDILGGLFTDPNHDNTGLSPYWEGVYHAHYIGWRRKASSTLAQFLDGLTDAQRDKGLRLLQAYFG